MTRTSRSRYRKPSRKPKRTALSVGPVIQAQLATIMESSAQTLTSLATIWAHARRRRLAFPNCKMREIFLVWATVCLWTAQTTQIRETVVVHAQQWTRLETGTRAISWRGLPVTEAVAVAATTTQTQRPSPMVLLPQLCKTRRLSPPPQTLLRASETSSPSAVRSESLLQCQDPFP